MNAAVAGFCAGALLFALPWPVAAATLGSLAWSIPLAAVPVLISACLARAGASSMFGHAPLPAYLVPLLLGAGGILLGVGWSGAAHVQALEHRVEAGGVDDAVRLRVRVHGAPVPLARSTPERPAIRFVADVIDGPDWAVGRRLQLSWHDAALVAAGETWQLAATVRAPLGFVNPGGTDRERWLLGQRIHGTGSVRRGERVQAARPGRVEHLRGQLADFVESRALSAGGVLTALLTGVDTRIGAELWATFRATGTVHLMVISGLHVGLAVGFGCAAARSMARVAAPLLLWVDARKIGALAGGVAGVAYTLLSGAGLPAVRACIMATPVLLLMAWGRRCQAGATLPVALAAVLFVDPLAVHQPGFWLSFGAVALLVIRFARRYGPDGHIGGFLRAQWALTLLMAPLLLLVTGQQPLVAPLANLLAVPLISFLVVPLVLLAGLLHGVLPEVAGLLLVAADKAVGWLLLLLAALARAPMLTAEPVGWPGGVALAGGLAWLWQPTGRQRLLLCLAVGAALPGPVPPIAFGTFRVMALDVGQGDALLVDTARHRLLFDAGPGFPGGFDTGRAVVRPALLATGRRYLDAVVLSHADLDHVGGLAGVLEALPAGRLYASFAQPGAEHCEGHSWTWDGVRFSLLAVTRARPGDPPANGNDRSCILLVEARGRRALLAGDIGARVEAQLIRTLTGPLDLLVAPHHGSAGSSSRLFVRVMRPVRVFVSAGLGNRYGHPHPRVLARYRAVGATVHETARGGALVWHSDAPDQVVGWRRWRSAYWRTPVPPVAGS